MTDIIELLHNAEHCSTPDRAASFMSGFGVGFGAGYGVRRVADAARRPVAKSAAPTRPGVTLEPALAGLFASAPRRAVCVGLNYPDLPEGGGRLTGCAEDAETIGGLLADHGFAVTVLTDEAATGPAVGTALAGLAGGGAFATAVIFFSGHGLRGRVDAALADEPDRRRDALLLADGDLLLDEALGQAVGACGGTAAVFLDACHSGGLVAEAAAAGVPGLTVASSAEDSTSLVPADRHAGGYVSGLLVDLLRANAGTGCTLRVGDVQAAVLDRWAGLCRHHKSAVLDGDDAAVALTRQFPVVTRTANPATPLFVARTPAE